MSPIWNLLGGFCAVVLVVRADDISFPPSLKEMFCKTSNPDYNNCLLDLAKKVIPMLAQGIPELQIPPLDPFQLDYYGFNRSIGHDIILEGVVENLKATGFSGLTLESIKADPIKLTVLAKYKLPEFRISTDYDLAAEFFGTTLQSQGHFEGLFADIRTVFKASGIYVERNGKKYVKLDQFHLKLKLGDGLIRITTKDPALQSNADFITSYFNSNPSGVTDMLQQFAFEHGVDDILKEMANRIFSVVPASEFLSP